MIDPELLDAPHYEITLERLPRAPTVLPQDHFPKAPLGKSLHALHWEELYTVLPLQQPRVFSRVALLHIIGGVYVTPRGALDWLISSHSDVSQEEQRAYVLGILEKDRRIFEWLFLQGNLGIRAKVRRNWEGVPRVKDWRADEESRVPIPRKGGRPRLIELDPDQIALAKRAKVARSRGEPWASVTRLCGGVTVKTLKAYISRLEGGGGGE